MRLCFVVQRYGHEVAGGAELHCREFATRLAARGHEVEVATTCATSYVDWANVYPEGDEELDGVLVHRLPVARPRDNRFFADVNARVLNSDRAPTYLQREWMRLQGPDVPGLRPFLRQHGARFDVVVFFTYLYATTYDGLASTPLPTPTLLHPTAHDEPTLHLSLFDVVFREPTAFAFSTEEEEALVRRRFRARQPGTVIGVGVDLDAHGDARAFRERYGLGDRPYLLFVGRIDPGKGSVELVEHFLAYKRRHPGPLALVIVGEPVAPPDPHPDIVLTGFVDDATKHGAYAGAVALVQPSYYESFSMVLTEAWASRIPALVQGRCEVLVGQSRRSRGGIPYTGFAEFEAAVDLVAEDELLRRAMGAAGRAFVEQRYRWDAVIDRYEGWLEQVARLGPGGPPAVLLPRRAARLSTA